jgi:hypothetical protein
MGKISWNTSAKEIDEFESDDRGFYDGPVPPPSVYRAKIMEILYKTYSTGSTGLRVTLGIDDPRKDKAVYKGARAWENVVDSPDTTFRIKQFLDSIGATGKDWAGMVEDSEHKVTKIGRIRVTEGMLVRVRTKLDTYNGEKKWVVAAWLPKSASAEAESGDDTDEGDADDNGEEPPF